MTLDAVLALKYTDYLDNLAEVLTLRVFNVNLCSTDSKKAPK